MELLLSTAILPTSDKHYSSYFKSLSANGRPVLGIDGSTTTPSKGQPSRY